MRTAPLLTVRTWAASSLTSLACLSALAPLAIQAQTPSPAAPAAAASPASAPSAPSRWPAPPSGFQWQTHQSALFLRPDGWATLEAEARGGDLPSSTFATSPEAFGPGHPFETGFTVQVIRGSMRLRQVDARHLALILLKPFLQGRPKADIVMLEQSQEGDFERTLLRYRDAPPDRKPVIVHKVVLASPVTDSVHVFTFESPADTWEDQWTRHGRVLTSRIGVLGPGPAR